MIHIVQGAKRATSTCGNARTLVGLQRFNSRRGQKRVLERARDAYN